MTNPQKLWQTLRRRWNMKDVTIYDLWRTCASFQSVLNHKGLTHTAIHARLNTKATDRALQAQADRLCSLVQEPVMLPTLTQELSATQ